MERQLSLDELRSLVDYDVPGLAYDLSRRRVVLRDEVMVEEGARALDGEGTALGIQGPHGLAPIGPTISAMPGRHRAWVLPMSGVAVRVEPLDDPETYLAAHRASLLAAQKVDEADLAKTRTGALGRRQRRACLRWAFSVWMVGAYFGLRTGLMFVFGSPATWLGAFAILGTLVGLLAAQRKTTSREGVVSKTSSTKAVVLDGDAIPIHDAALFRRLVPGVRYRVHTALDTPTFEPVAPAAPAAGTPYR